VSEVIGTLLLVLCRGAIFSKAVAATGPASGSAPTSWGVSSGASDSRSGARPATPSIRRATWDRASRMRCCRSPANVLGLELRVDPGRRAAARRRPRRGGAARIRRAMTRCTAPPWLPPSSVRWSVALMLYAGRANQHILVTVLFVFWVLAPFVALAWADRMSVRWSVVTRTALHWMTLVITVGSLAIYVYRVLRPRGRPARSCSSPCRWRLACWRRSRSLSPRSCHAGRYPQALVLSLALVLAVYGGLPAAMDARPVHEAGAGQPSHHTEPRGGVGGLRHLQSRGRRERRQNVSSVSREDATGRQKIGGTRRGWG